jgi:hypothetical protein
MNFRSKYLEASQKAAPMFIRAIAEDSGLEVKFGGSTPGYARQLHTVYLPQYAIFSASQLAASDVLQEIQSAVDALFKGTGLHETGHPLYTNPDLCWRNPGDLGSFLWNSLEDIRCDSIHQRKLAGAKRIFNDGYGRLIKMGYWGRADLSDFKSAFSSWVLCHGRAVFCGQSVFDEIGVKADAAVRQLAGDKFADDAWKIVARVKFARDGIDGTIDVFHIIEDLLKFLKEQQQSQPQPQPQPQSKKSDDSDDSAQPQPQGSSGQAGDSDDDSDDSAQPQPQGSSGQAGDSDDDSDDSAQPQPQGSSGQAGDSDDDSDDSAQPQPQGSSGQAGDSDDDSDDSAQPQPQGSSGQAGSGSQAGSPDPDAIQDLLDASGDDLPESVGDAFANALDEATDTAKCSGASEFCMPRSEKAGCSNVLYAGDRDTRPLTMRVQRLLETQSKAYVSHDRMGSQIDNQLLYRVPMGERDIFVDEVATRRVDTAVHVLVDASTSMNSSNRIGIARMAALRLCVALSEISGVCMSASAFPHRLDGRDDQVLQLLPPGASPRRYAENFLTLRATIGSTPLAQALTDAEFTLLHRPEPRKICVVLTDGEPNGGVASCSPIVNRMSLSGIEVLGLGIETMRFPNLFPRFEVVHNARDLESALFKLLQTTLLRKAA